MEEKNGECITAQTSGSDLPKDYLEELNELRTMLKWLLNKDLLGELVALSEMIDRGYVESYCRIQETSRWGKNCGYAVKAKELFLALHERQISGKIKYIYENFVKPMEVSAENEERKRKM